MDLSKLPVLEYAAGMRQGEVVEPVRVGPYLVVGREARLPARCLWCNAPAEGERVVLRLEVPTDLAWRRAEFWTLGSGGVVIHACYCVRHGAQRAAAEAVFRWLTVAAVVPALAAIGCRVSVWEAGVVWCGLAAAVMLVAALVARVVARRGLRVDHAKGGYVCLDVRCREFLEGFPGAGAGK
jgi:hypothetical protein